MSRVFNLFSEYFTNTFQNSIDNNNVYHNIIVSHNSNLSSILFIYLFVVCFPFVSLDVRSLAVASRSRPSEKPQIVDELAHIEHAHMGRSFRARRTVATCHG